MAEGILYSQIEYHRVDPGELARECGALKERLENAGSFEEFFDAFLCRYKLDDSLTDMAYARLKKDLNSNDARWLSENEFYDKNAPAFSELMNTLTKAVLGSPYKEELSGRIGDTAITAMENQFKGFDERQLPLMQEENELTAAYSAVTSSIRVSWDGELLYPFQMVYYTTSEDRSIRKKAFAAVAQAWEEKRHDIEDIYDRLVKNRDAQAKVMGLSDYVDLAYIRMNRIGFDQSDVRTFREQVKKYIVPVYAALEENRRKRLGLDELYGFDSPLSFSVGNPQPVGGGEKCTGYVRNIFKRISPMTGRFIDDIMERGFYDFESRPGKRSGGYMTPLERYRTPFIFASFDGTDYNAFLISHEGGHAFQYWLKAGEPVRDLASASYEVSETHAMTMEFFANAHMDIFFGDRADDYKKKHLETAVMRLPYQCQQDEFQEIVYKNPGMTPGDRNKLWHRLEKEYGMYKPNPGSACTAGTGWQRIPHAFYWPFYAIDYALAQTAALEFKALMDKDYHGAFDKYLRFCMDSGSKDFRQLLRGAGLDDPFKEGSMEKLARELLNSSQVVM